MATWTFQRASALALGLLLLLGMSLSVLQANAMAVGMATSGQQMSASGMTDCGSCKDHPGTKTMVCDAACAAAAVATVPQFAMLATRLPADRPQFRSPVPSSWTASPNPHPPQLFPLI